MEPWLVDRISGQLTTAPWAYFYCQRERPRDKAGLHDPIVSMGGHGYYVVGQCIFSAFVRRLVDQTRKITVAGYDHSSDAGRLTPQLPDRSGRPLWLDRSVGATAPAAI